jgi:hypothetical protein
MAVIQVNPRLLFCIGSLAGMADAIVLINRRQTLALKGFIVSSGTHTLHTTAPNIPTESNLFPSFLPLLNRTTALACTRTSEAAVTGMVINADNYLLRFESQQRLTENDIRRQARNELATRGVIATETEIRKWKAQKEVERVRRESELEQEQGRVGEQEKGEEP